MPNSIIDIFKNRRGRWTMMSIWQYCDLGTLRTYDLFATTSDLKPIEDFQIVDFTEEKTQELENLEKLYNNSIKENEINETKIEENNDFKSMVSTINEAFNSEERSKEKLKEKSFRDLI